MPSPGVRPPRHAPKGRQTAEAACENYLKDAAKSNLTSENVQVLRTSPSYIITGTLRILDWTDVRRPATRDWTCTIRQDGYQWQLISLNAGEFSRK
jgi:hypothetical protein